VYRRRRAYVAFLFQSIGKNAVNSNVQTSEEFLEIAEDSLCPIFFTFEERHS
jgi:hypothetical protein